MTDFVTDAPLKHCFLAIIWVKIKEFENNQGLVQRNIIMVPPFLATTKITDDSLFIRGRFKQTQSVQGFELVTGI